jgi:ABC-type phosphate/phosphonate transport system substrate-binding protein
VAFLAAAAYGQPPGVGVLHVGATGTLTGHADSPKEKAGLETLRRFIKDETGLTSEIAGQMDWQELATQMAKGRFQVGVFQGYEFAWAQEKHADLKPLTLGVNVHRYSVTHVVVRRDHPAKDFAALQGQALSLPTTSQAFPRLFLDRQSQASGQTAEKFFSQITSPDNVEDALDEVLDGKTQVAVVDQAALEAYKRRKPGRANQLKEVSRSQAVPPLVVAYYGAALDETTLRRFKDGLLGAARKEKGEMLLTLSRLTGFEGVPADFGRVLAATRKAYPPPNGKKE